jgi:hypothetical protein
MVASAVYMNASVIRPTWDERSKMRLRSKDGMNHDSTKKPDMMKDDASKAKA